MKPRFDTGAAASDARRDRPATLRQDMGGLTPPEAAARRKPTLQDVARLAQVSASTVSRCLTRPQLVRPQVRRRVEEAIAQLGYLPHGAARALASQRSYTMGAVIPTLDNAIFARGTEALQQRLYEAGYTLFIAASEYDPETECRQLETMIARGVDGVMLIGEAHDRRVYQRLAQAHLPYINAWTYKPDSPHPSVGFDNYRAARRLADYLIDIGHRRFAMIAGITQGNDRAAERVAGVMEALADRGLSLPPHRLIERPYDIAEGRRAMRLLMETDEPPTAVVCGNDVLAFGALFECQAMRLPVPGRVSITGFDDLDLASHVQPPLTTIRVPSDEMGCKAAEFLLARLDNRPYPAATALDVTLIIRETTAPPTDR